MRVEPAQAHGVHAHAVVVGAACAEGVSVASGPGETPAAARARAMREAVEIAVPEGASALSGWCISMTSTDSKKGAALSAKLMARTAERA